MFREGISNTIEYDENISQAVGIGATVTLFTFQVPSRSVLKIMKFANYTDTPAAVGTGLTWHINRNGVGVRPYDNILDIIGQSYQPEKVTIAEFRGGDLLTIVTVNGTAGVVLSGIRILFELGDS